MFNYIKNVRTVLKTIDNPLKRLESASKKDSLEKEFWDKEAEECLLSFDEDLFRYDENEEFPPRHRYFYSLLESIRGKHILDCCCGYGFTTVKCAKRGAYITGIDISPKMIELAKKNAEFNQVSQNVNLEVMSAHKLSFEDNIFDYVVGIGALHHLNLELAGKEISRVLKPGGKAIFLEPRIPFKWIMVLRSLIPVRCYESPGGGSLSDREVHQFSRYFSTSKPQYFILLRKLFRLPILKRFASKLDSTDLYLINRCQFLKKFCWAFVLEFTK
ncbi:methyltransferase domain-containing protein [candidate division WOR-3 bacterium]|nr:methyltransferase domain-containing protein [candidate division WOR-3 bacterium]MCK4528061.1 methyltransferase domain-containing protein [candidate division WOR-3 bacterium]